MQTFTLTQDNECNNCRRKVEAGEVMSAESLDKLNAKGGLCSNCAPVEDKPKKKKVNDG